MAVTCVAPTHINGIPSSLAMLFPAILFNSYRIYFLLSRKQTGEDVAYSVS